jgi:AcrR family transcriptional regulator
MTETAIAGAPPPRRRDRQQAETRRDLALAAFQLARANGLAGVRVPEIARAAGVSTRTFNNYFSSKEEAIAWPAVEHAAAMARGLLDRPADEPLADALVEMVGGLYRPPRQEGLPPNWLRDFRGLVAREPALHGEYLKASEAAAQALARAIATRMHSGIDELRPHVVAAVVVGAERAAVMYWMASRKRPLVQVVRDAVRQAVSGVEDWA